MRKSGKRYYIPSAPPMAHYTIDCSIGFSAGTLKMTGTEVVRVRNNSSMSIHRLALDWRLGSDQTLEVTVGKKAIAALSSSEQAPLGARTIFELPKALSPGREDKIIFNFSQTLPTHGNQDRITLTRWQPRLWWDLPAHDNFDVKTEAPSDYVLATSGLLDRKSGYYHGEGIRSFGLFLGKGLHVLEANAGGTHVRCLFTAKGTKCARLLLGTAVDVIKFYRQRFGFYPYKSLTIIPGGDEPMGGYPVATGIVAIHGQERMREAPRIHWQWIMAHEIGHQYWGEYVMEKDSPGWLWIGLGIYADREYVRAKGLSLEKHREMMASYIEGVRNGLDTTVDRPPEQLAGIDFDHNNVVIHGKGYSIISALARLLGVQTFDRVYRRCLKQFAGRQLGAAEFRAICEVESGQNLGWFFEQWARSNKYLSYQITSKKCTRQDDHYRSQVRVECLGTLKMPVPVVAYFQDGTHELKFTERLWETNVLQFESSAPLKEARLDPNEELALVVPPPPLTEANLLREVNQMPWTGAGKHALDLFNEARNVKLATDRPWLKLGLSLYDGRYYQEALDAFHRLGELTVKDSLLDFVSLVWQGHILDVLGRREEALQCYKEALARDAGGTVRHDQYGIEISRHWVEERLKKPFQRR